MKQPGDKGMQGIPISRLEVDPDITLQEAATIASNLGADTARIDYKEHETYAEIDSDFVINAIDFRKDDVFLVDGVDRRNDALLVVKETNQFGYGLYIGLYDEQPSEHSVEWNEGDLGYAELWMHWLRGNIIPVREEATLTRVDTGEKVQP